MFFYLHESQFQFFPANAMTIPSATVGTLQVVIHNDKFPAAILTLMPAGAKLDCKLHLPPLRSLHDGFEGKAQRFAVHAGQFPDPEADFHGMGGRIAHDFLLHCFQHSLCDSQFVHSSSAIL
jgi:hypothetical protein